MDSKINIRIKATQLLPTVKDLAKVHDTLIRDEVKKIAQKFRKQALELEDALGMEGYLQSEHLEKGESD